MGMSCDNVVKTAYPLITQIMNNAVGFLRFTAVYEHISALIGNQYGIALSHVYKMH